MPQTALAPSGRVPNSVLPIRTLAKERAATYCQDMEWKNRIEYALFRGFVAALNVVPALAARQGGERLGRIGGPVLRRRWRIVNEQLAATYPELEPAERRTWTRAVFGHLGRTAAEVFGPGGEELLAGTEIVPGWEPLDRALDRGRGAIAVTAHLGNFELGGAVLSRRYRVLDVVKPQRNPLFDRYVQRLRHQRGIDTVPMQSPGRAVLSHLRSGGLVTLLVDQDAGDAGTQLDFLGRRASAWTGAARFALRTSCPVVPVAMHRISESQHQLRIGDAIEPPVDGDMEQAVVEYTRLISQAVEDFIRRDPQQWFWVHRRWKGASQGENG